MVVGFREVPWLCHGVHHSLPKGDVRVKNGLTIGWFVNGGYGWIDWGTVVWWICLCSCVGKGDTSRGVESWWLERVSKRVEAEFERVNFLEFWATAKPPSFVKRNQRFRPLFGVMIARTLLKDEQMNKWTNERWTGILINPNREYIRIY